MLGLVIGGVASGVGKTTLTLGLIAALRARGLSVQPFKVGPDYIDPSHHAQAAGRPSRNLDSWMVPEPALRELFWRAAGRSDAAIVEGVMGLFDGRTGGGEIGSTAHVAKLLGLPVLLVVDAAKAARSVAATVLGCQALDPDLSIIGVVLNNVASTRHAEIGREAIESLTSLPVLGWSDARSRPATRGTVPRPRPGRRAPVPGQPDRAGDGSGRAAGGSCTADAAGERSAPLTPPSSGMFPAEPVPQRARIAVARDAAFNFYYEDSLDLLAAWGAELVPFSPLSRRCPAALMLMPSISVAGSRSCSRHELAANGPMLESIRSRRPDRSADLRRVRRPDVPAGAADRRGRSGRTNGRVSCRASAHWWGSA